MTTVGATGQKKKGGGKGEPPQEGVVISPAVTTDQERNTNQRMPARQGRFSGTARGQELIIPCTAYFGQHGHGRAGVRPREISMD